jgi:hypothetical protein
MDHCSSSLEARLSKVEKELWFWRLATTAILLLFVAGAASLNEEIVAKKITIVDDKGQPLITLGSWGQGSGGAILINSMSGNESVVESIQRDLDLRKELGEKWSAAIVGLPGSAAIYLVSKNAGSGAMGQMKIEPTSLGLTTHEGRTVGFSARDPYESEYQGHKQPVEGSVSFALTDYSNIESEPPSPSPSRGIDFSIFKKASQIEFDDITTKGTTNRVGLEVESGTNGMARLRLSDDSEKSQMALGVSRGSPAMILTGTPQKGRLDLFVLEGQPRLDLYGPEARSSEWRPDTSLILKPDHSSLLVFTHDNSVKTAIGVGKDGKPFFFDSGSQK